MDILIGFGTILDPQIASTNNLDWVAIANPREMVYYTLEVDATLIAIVRAVVTSRGFVLVDENIRAKRNRPRWRRKERGINQMERAGIG